MAYLRLHLSLLPYVGVITKWRMADSSSCSWVRYGQHRWSHAEMDCRWPEINGMVSRFTSLPVVHPSLSPEHWTFRTEQILHFQKHRVCFPTDKAEKQKPRHSLAFFVHPDNDCIVKCLDGSDKYPPISALDYLNMRFAATYWNDTKWQILGFRGTWITGCGILDTVPVCFANYPKAQISQQSYDYCIYDMVQMGLIRCEK